MSARGKGNLIAILLLFLSILPPLSFSLARMAHLVPSDPFIETTWAGLSIIGAGFLISWSCELMQLDLPPGFAIALLALVNVLPEYAVDIYFSYKAAFVESYKHFATSNMTGANRILIGVGWGLIVLINFLRNKDPKARLRVEMSEENAMEVFMLLLATIYSFTIVLKRSLHIVDTLVLFSIFGLYLYFTLKTEKREPSLGGPTELISNLPTFYRRLSTWGLFALAALSIYLSAEPFSEGLIHIGREFGIDEFILVQWIAPIASEAPELIAASYFAWKLLTTDAFGALVSSKVNQWTLLVGFIPLVYGIASIWSVGHLVPSLALDRVQVDEIFLTAAQSLLAGVMLADLKFTWWEALLLFLLFAYQLVHPSEEIRVIVAWIYIALSVIWILKVNWRDFINKVLSILRGEH